jgi:hypothetical protein
MMYCGRRLLPSGIRLFCGRQQRLLSASSYVVKSSLPDVELPNIALPDYVWQRVDQWPDKVAIVSIHKVSKHSRVTSGSKWLALCTQPMVRGRQSSSDARMLTENTEVRTVAAQNTYGKVMSQYACGTCLTAV